MDGKLSRRDILKLSVAGATGGLIAVFAPKVVKALGERSEEKTIARVTDFDLFLSDDPGSRLVVFKHKGSPSFVIVTYTDVPNDLGKQIILSGENITGEIGKDPNGYSVLAADKAEPLRIDTGDMFQRQSRLGAFANVASVLGSSKNMQAGYFVFAPATQNSGTVLTLMEERISDSFAPRTVHIPFRKVFLDRTAPQGTALNPKDLNTMYALVNEEQPFDWGIDVVATQPIIGEYKGVKFSIDMVTGAGLGVKQIKLDPEAAMNLVAQSLFRAIWTNGTANYGGSKPFPTGENYEREFEVFMQKLAQTQYSSDPAIRRLLDFKVKATSPVTGKKETVVMRPMMQGDLTEGVVSLQTAQISIVNIKRTMYVTSVSYSDQIGAGMVTDESKGILDLRFAMEATAAKSREALSSGLSTTPKLMATGKPGETTNKEIHDAIYPALEIIT